jgi:predicted neutral ceramidase superfamily lipid hydrolase
VDTATTFKVQLAQALCWAVLVVLVAVPYLAFHLLFQDTSYVRYALPLVAPVAFLVIRGVEGVAPRAVRKAGRGRGLG